MIAQTSLEAYQPETRAPQKQRVLLALLQYANMGIAATAAEISQQTGIKLTTVHARICDLKRGYQHDGVTYFAVQYDTVKHGKTSFQRFTVSTSMPDNETLEQINEVKRKAVAALREWRIRYNRYVSAQVKNLFDE